MVRGTLIDYAKKPHAKQDNSPKSEDVVFHGNRAVEDGNAQVLCPLCHD